MGSRDPAAYPPYSALSRPDARSAAIGNAYSEKALPTVGNGLRTAARTTTTVSRCTWVMALSPTNDTLRLHGAFGRTEPSGSRVFCSTDAGVPSGFSVTTYRVTVARGVRCTRMPSTRLPVRVYWSTAIVSLPSRMTYAPD